MSSLTPPPPPTPAPSAPAAGSPPPAVPPEMDAPGTGEAAPQVAPQLWTEDDLPTLAWCMGKGFAKAVVMIFVSVLIPLELLATIFAPNVLPIQFPLSTSLLVIGGSAVAACSGAATATQTTRIYGLFKALSQVVKLAYLFLLAVVGIIVITVNPISITFGFRDLIYLFMIGTALTAVAGLITLYEDLAHPGERLPYDFPLSRRELRSRQDAYNRSIGMEPEL